MRIKLEKGKQAELILSAKRNKTWLNLSQKLNLCEAYVRNELRKESRLLSEDNYKMLCDLANKNYDNEILEKLEDNWGKSNGGTISKGNKKQINIPNESKELAELYGILLGDGCITKIKSYKIGTYQLRIVGDSRYDYNYLTEYVKPLIENLFKINVRVRKLKNENAIVLVCDSRILIDFMENKGFKPGNKIKNQLGIPDWIKNNNSFLAVCIRGIYDTDGCVYKIPNQNVYQIQFTNHNIKLLTDVRDSLILLNIIPSKISQNRRIYITKKSELQKFLNIVNFKNTKHLNKVQKWDIKPHGVVSN